MSAVSEPDRFDDENMGETTNSRVHKAIVADIVSGYFAPGARLKIADLCKRYGLSHMPIRQALQQLQGEGLIVMVPHKGASVRALDRQFLTEHYQVQMALCTIYYRDIVACADAALDEALATIQRQFDEAMERGDVAACDKFDHNLHHEIESRCQNREAVRLGQTYKSLTGTLRDVLGRSIDRLRGISEEHWKIVEAIKARDGEAAIAAGQEHIRRAQGSMNQTLPDTATHGPVSTEASGEASL